MTKREEKELRRMLTELLEMGYSKEEILAAFTSLVEEKAREESILVRRQPPAVKAGTMDV